MIVECGRRQNILLYEENPTLFALPNTFTPFAPAVAHNTPFCHIFFFSVKGMCIGKWSHVFACILMGVVLEDLTRT
jgi:hypothetical protein